MKVAGLNLKKNEIRLTILEGPKGNPSLIDSQKYVNKNNTDLPSRMNWYADSFSRIIDTHKIELVAYRLSLISPTMDQVHNFYFPYGILNNLCWHKNIRSREFSSKKLKNPKALGHPKDSNIYELCDTYIGNLCVSDKEQKYSALAAWFALEE